MEQPETTPAWSKRFPQVRHAPGVNLTAAEMALLRLAFQSSQDIFVEREFHSGYSGAAVLLVSPGSGQASVVVKLGAPTELQREYAAYRQFVEKASPQNTARLQSEPLVSEDGQLALLVYTFAGGDPRLPTRSLQAYYESQGGQAMALVLDRVFRVYGRQWWANNQPRKFTLGEQYDRLLPFHLKLKPVFETKDSFVTLSAGQVNATFLRDLYPGQLVRLQGFQVSEVRPDRGEVSLTADPPPGEASAPLRLRLETADITAYRPGDRLETLDATITTTRQTFLAEAAHSALPTLSPNDPQFNLDDRKYPNPLCELPNLLDRVVETRVSTIHGDLNLQNILVDEATGFAWLIDFTETRLGPTLFDLQRLEAQVITWLLPSAITHADLGPATISQLLAALHTDPPRPHAPHPALQEPYAVLMALRRLARQYLMDDQDWDEYYFGLIVVLLGTLKFPHLGALALTLAIVGAATAWDLIGKPVTIVSDQPFLTQYRDRGQSLLETSFFPLAAQPAPDSSRWPRWLTLLGIGWFKPKPKPSQPLALIINVQGWVEVRRKASDRVVHAAFGMPLFFGDAIITYEASATDVVCNNGFLFHLDKQSTLIVRCMETNDRLPLGRLPADLAHRLIQPGLSLSAMTQADRKTAKQAIDNLSLGERAQTFLQARLYQRSDLPRRAIFELEGLTSEGQAPGIAQALGEVYYQAERLDQAELHYKIALSEAQARGDLIGQAEAQVGLGYLAKARGEADAAAVHWRAAVDLYMQEGWLVPLEQFAVLLPSVQFQYHRKSWLNFIRQSSTQGEKVWRGLIDSVGRSTQVKPVRRIEWGPAIVVLIYIMMLVTVRYSLSGAPAVVGPTATPTPILVAEKPTSTTTNTPPKPTSTPRPTNTSTSTATDTPSLTDTSPPTSTVAPSPTGTLPPTKTITPTGIPIPPRH